MRRLFFQGIRFLGIGFLNTAVDFAVLNFLASLFEIYRGGALGVLNVISFAVAVGHSYFWNKYWAFAEDDQRFWENAGKFIAASAVGIGVLGAVGWGAAREFGFGYYFVCLAVLIGLEIVMWRAFRLKTLSEQGSEHKEFVLFIAVSIVGILINSGLVAGVTAYVDPLFGFNRELWLNLVKAGATAVSLIWNFAGYKMFVFKR